MKASKTVLARVLFMVLVIAISYPAMAQLKADFTASPQSGCAPLIVSFKDVSAGNPVSWKWDLGDGVTSPDQNPSKSYFDPGVYTVKLTVYNGSKADSVIKTAYITVYQNPVAVFNVSDSSGCFPLNVTYNDASNAGSGAISNWAWDFGDGNIATTRQPSHAYTAAGTFSVSLTVTNNYGCSGSIQKTNIINVSPGVHADFGANNTNVCHAPATVSFTNAATGSGSLNYTWRFGDGSNSTVPNPAHNYRKAGVYKISFKVQSSAGCKDSISRPLTISFVKSAIAVSDTLCSNRQVQFINASSPAPSSSVWSFGDSTGSDTLSPYKTFAQTGLYTIKLVNTFPAGCTDSTTKKIHVISGPVALFNIIDSAGCSLPFTANFQNNSSGTGLSYIWDFGDGNTSNAVNPVHEYKQYGIYTVVLKAINITGCASTIIKTNCIIIQPVKIAGIAGIASGGCVPYKVQPAVQMTNAVPVAKYHWDFGDGFTSDSAMPVHTYTTEGIFTVKVNIVTAGGCTDSFSMIDSVGHKLHPDFTIAPANVCASTQVGFVNTTAGNSDFLWWYLGDGTIVYKQPDPLHNYADTGTFSPILIVMENGCMDTIIKKNAVHIKGPIAKFTAQNNCISPLRVNFNNSSIEDITRKWDFGDASFDTSANPVHLYKTPGVYNVKLFVSNGTCSYTTALTENVIQEKGVIQISASTTCRNTKVNLNVVNVNRSNIATTVWNLGNGSSQTVGGTLSSYSYNINGTYNISAVLTDILGCFDTLNTIQKIIIYGPTARVRAVETGGCEKSTIHFIDSSSTDGLHALAGWTFNYKDNNTVKYLNGPFSHNYQDTGLYSAIMTVTDSYGCRDSVQANAVHITRPYATFTLSDTLVCPGKQVSFNNTTVGVGLQYNWVLGDGSQTTAASPSHLYTVQGIYTPALFVTDINNCKDSVSILQGVHVFTPSAKFLMSDSFSACPPLSINFGNHSQNYVSYLWNFGDGNTSNVLSPAHSYTYPGIYPVKLVLNGNGACMDSAIRMVTIKGPTGTLQYAKKPVCYPYAQQFAVTSQNAVQYVWDYSDGNTNITNTDTSSHTYKPGFYLPRIILVDAAGCKVPVKGADTLKVYGLTAKASVNSYLLCDSGQITAADSSVTNDIVTNRQWMFGDNTTGSNISVTHNYTATGTYTVKLAVSTLNGCSDTATVARAVKVVQSPVINIASDTSFCVPANVSLQAKVIRADTSVLVWNWNLGNGISSADQNPSSILFSNAGNYPVSVTAKNSSGCSGSYSSVLAVHSLPNVKTGNDTTICRSSVLGLQATGAVAYTWTNAQGISCTACSSPLVSPDSTKMYSVTGKDAYGCSSSDSILINVSQPVRVSVSNSDTLCNGETRQLAASGAQTYQWFPAVYLSDASAAQPTFFASKDTAITYKVIGYAEKKCFADTATVKVKVYPIPQMQVLQNSITVNSGRSVQLSTINSVDVTKWKWSPQLWINNPNSANPIAQPRESITYTVVAANDGACVTRAQISVTVICNGTNIFVPNTFSPNGDGVNDVFYARGTGLYNIKSFRVFNRWGQLVFERLNTGANNPAEGWDGTFKGQKQQSDVYVYIIEVLCNNNTIVPVKGNITLVK